MISWTEHEVAHWRDDLQYRRAAMRLVAYHVYPREADRADAVRMARDERLDLERQRQWFSLLQDRVEQRVQWMSSGQGESTAGGSDAVTPERIAELDRRLESDLARLGLTEWPFAVSVRLTCWTRYWPVSD